MLKEILSAIDPSSPLPKVLLTPAYVNPGVFKRSLALNVEGLANLSVQSFNDFIIDRALHLFPGKSYLSGDRLFWTVFELCKSLRAELGYFSESVEFEGFCSLMIHSMMELRLNGVDREDTPILPNTPKWTDVRLIMNEYARVKKDRKFFDYADAVVELVKFPTVVERVFLIQDQITALEHWLVVELGITVIESRPDRESFPPRLSGYRVDTPYQEALQTIRNVMEDLRTASVPVRIGICTPDYNATYYHMRPVLEKLGMPDLVHFMKGEPLFSTGAGNLWKYVGEWVQNNFSVYRLIRILESGSFDRGWIVDTPRDVKGKEITPALFHTAVRYFRDSELVLFNPGFLPAFKEFLAGHVIADTDEDREDFQNTAIAVARAVAERFAAIHTDGLIRNQLEALRELFLEAVRIQDEADAAALARIELTIESLLESITGPDLTLSELITIVNERLGSIHIISRLPDFTRPVVGTLEDLRYFTFDKLYFIGLNERGLPGRIFQNPVLLDYEKKELNGRITGSRLQTREDVLEEEETKFHQIKATVNGEVILSAPLKDLTSGRDLLVSRYLLSTWNAKFNAKEDYRSIVRKLEKDPRSQNNHIADKPEDAFYPYELAVAARLLHPDGNDGLLESDFLFARSVNTLKKRRRGLTHFDEYWGIVKADERRRLPVFSASRIRKWTTCPYQYFLEYELKLDSNEDYDAQALEWLDNLRYGSFAHDVFYKFLLRVRETKGLWYNSVGKGDEKVLWEVFEEVAEEYRRTHPVNSSVHYESQLARLRRDVSMFFEREMQNPDTRMYVELAFHMPAKEGREPLVRRTDPAEITLDDGTTLPVRGSIDRVDRTKDGRFVLYDYKTGRVKRPPKDRPFFGGELVQAGLYSEVVAQIDPAIKDPLFKFYYTSENAGFVDYSVDYPPIRDHFMKLLTAIVQELRSGNFVPVAERTFRGGGACRFCDYQKVCIEGRWGLATELKEHDEHYDRLQHIKREDLP